MEVAEIGYTTSPVTTVACINFGNNAGTIPSTDLQTNHSISKIRNCYHYTLGLSYKVVAEFQTIGIWRK